MMIWVKALFYALVLAALVVGVTLAFAELLYWVMKYGAGQ